MDRVFWWRVAAALVVALSLYCVAHKVNAMGKKPPGSTMQFPGPCASEKLHVQMNGASGWVDVYPGTLKPGECIVGFNKVLAPFTRSCCEVEGTAMICSEPGAVIVEGDENVLCTKKFDTQGNEIPIPTPLPTPSATSSPVPTSTPFPSPTVTPIPTVSATPTPQSTSLPTITPTPTPCIPLRYWEQEQVDRYWEDPIQVCQGSIYCPCGDGSYEYLICAPSDVYCGRVACQCESWWEEHTKPWGEGKGCFIPGEETE